MSVLTHIDTFEGLALAISLAFARIYYRTNLIGVRVTVWVN